MKKIWISAFFMMAIVITITGCNKAEPTAVIEQSASPLATAAAPDPTATLAPAEEGATDAPTGPPSAAPTPTEGSTGTVKGGSKDNSAESADSLPVIAEPESVTVLVNKNFALPKDYEPKDLVYPNVPFIFKEKVDKRKMRSVAATALEEMFAGAEKDDIQLAGASAYRSYATQKVLFHNYVKRDGLEQARTYSALAGTSEHETGLAIDVSGSDGKCAVQDCFAGTKEAIWIEEHAVEYGFIVRYPKGKEAITGYQYEPWHIRYVGIDAAKEISEKDSTLENYLNAVPVSK